eukprot:1708120-Alexandrium_andersonii.AAC.1
MSVAIAESLQGAVDAVEGADPAVTSAAPSCEPSTSSGAAAAASAEEKCVAEWAAGVLSSVAVLIDRG